MLELDDQELPLAAGFDAATRDDWMRAVRSVILKSKTHSDHENDDAEFGAAFARQLVTKHDDGFEIQPLYDAADAPPPAPLPGIAPFVRGTHAAPIGWEIRQRVWPQVDGSSAVTELESGATGVLLELTAGIDASELARLLDGVYLDLAPVSLASPLGDDGVAGARLLAAHWEALGTPVEARRGTLGVDPIGAWARSGGIVDLDDAQASAAALVAELADLAPQARVLVADGAVWHDAGATDAQQLAWTIATASAYVRNLVDVGVGLEHAAGQLEFRWGVTADQFGTITTLRAARRLWARVAEIAGLAPPARRSFHHADGSRVMLTRYDVWTNALRSTVACFGAAYGGADAVTIWPHDSMRTSGGSPLGRRIARNTQTVLQYESNLARVADPAGGSWFVERLTDQLAQAAWAELRRIEAAGGIVAAVAAGDVHDRLAAARSSRQRRVATRARPLTGLSEFPDIDEQPPPPLEPATLDHAATAFEPLRLHRLADDFERQRARADAHAAVTGSRPTIFLATLGSPAESTARATFAKNMFEAGGILTVPGEPSQFASSGATVVCLSSNDANYRVRGEQVAAELRAAGATRIYAAGHALELDGVDEEVGVGSDVVDVIERALDALGVAP
jgi:methylmalonyl-CoA mutase